MIFKLILFLTLILSFPLNAKKDEPNPVTEIQAKISQAYELGWDKSSPVDMDFIQKKSAEVESLYERRKKKQYLPLIDQIEADLKIVEMRHKVNLLNQELTELQKQNLLDENALLDLKEQLR